MIFWMTYHPQNDVFELTYNSKERSKITHLSRNALTRGAIVWTEEGIYTIKLTKKQLTKIDNSIKLTHDSFFKGKDLGLKLGCLWIGKFKFKKDIRLTKIYRREAKELDKIGENDALR